MGSVAPAGRAGRHGAAAPAETRAEAGLSGRGGARGSRLPVRRGSQLVTYLLEGLDRLLLHRRVDVVVRELSLREQARQARDGVGVGCEVAKHPAEVLVRRLGRVSRNAARRKNALHTSVRRDDRASWIRLGAEVVERVVECQRQLLGEVLARVGRRARAPLRDDVGADGGDSKTDDDGDHEPGDPGLIVDDRLVVLPRGQELPVAGVRFLLEGLRLRPQVQVAGNPDDHGEHENERHQRADRGTSVAARREFLRDRLALHEAVDEKHTSRGDRDQPEREQGVEERVRRCARAIGAVRGRSGRCDADDRYEPEHHQRW